MMLKGKLDEIFKGISLNSLAFSDYFHLLMTENKINSTRHGIRVLIVYFYCEIVSSHMEARSILFRPLVALFSFCIYTIVFLITMKIRRPLTMMRIASVMVVLCLAYTILMSSDNNEIMETQYSLSICIILMMYTLFQLKFLITMLMCAIYIMIFVAIGNRRLSSSIHGHEEDHDNETEGWQSERSLILVRHSDDWNMTGKKYPFIVGQCLLFCLVYLTGIYLRFFNSIRRKSAFLKLVQYAESKMKIDSAVKVQVYWIEAIMPKAVKTEFLKKIAHKDSNSLVYCKNFDNVSILFADIVGFTAMSSNKSAEQLVFLLNDLYNRFDEYGRMMNCEKIGTLGDCYYCVSGCPVSRSDHAKCCVEMGLGMCRMILDFNEDNKENVNMRVGIHSGRVIAAIIGNHRFRFDVFSNDVIIANSLESSGLAGRVHISENTHKLVRHAYAFEDGDLLEVKKEIKRNLEGFIQKLVKIKTYFVLTDHLIHSIKEQKNKSNVEKKMFYKNKSKKEKKISFESIIKETKRFSDESVSNSNNSLKFRNMSNKKKVVPTRISRSLPGDIQSREFKKKNDRMKYHLELIRILQTDSEKPVDFFQQPPINSFTLRYIDKEIEFHFLTHCTDHIKVIRMDSYKFAIFMDSVACLLFSTIIIFTEFVMVSMSYEVYSFYLIFFYCVGVIATLISAWISFTFKSFVRSDFLRTFFCTFSHPLSRLVISIYISSLPSILVLVLRNEQLLYTDYTYTASYFTLTIFALVANCIFMTSFSFVKQISTMVCFILALKVFWFPLDRGLPIDPGLSECHLYYIKNMEFQTYRLQCHYTFQLFHIFILIYYLTEENEKNVRIHFYATRESEIRNGEAKRAQKVAESLLYNIIPRYVFSQITKSRKKASTESAFSYAHDISNAGVVFACISNFFADYYREDYKGGEVALKLLHSIICRFDNMLRKPIYDNLEKVKTINDCYMLASGLNTALTNNSDDHLVKLMLFAIEMLTQLKEFNDENIIGSHAFKLKIGYNSGPVTAGIIGTSKPLYDIWGDTVNVASRMYSTAPSGCIQVSGDVKRKMNDFFKFQYRGKIPMKGKGEMRTYLLYGIRQNKKEKKDPRKVKKNTKRKLR